MARHFVLFALTGDTRRRLLPVTIPVNGVRAAALEGFSAAVWRPAFTRPDSLKPRQAAYSFPSLHSARNHTIGCQEGQDGFPFYVGKVGYSAPRKPSPARKKTAPNICHNTP